MWLVVDFDCFGGTPEIERIVGLFPDLRTVTPPTAESPDTARVAVVWDGRMFQDITVHSAGKDVFADLSGADRVADRCKEALRRYLETP